MSSKRPTTRSLPLIVYLVIAVAALIGTGAGWAWYVTYPPERMMALIVGIVAVVVVAAALLANRRAWQIIMNLAPTALLLAILPFVTKQLGAQTTIVVLVAITTPWLVGTAMLPAFRPVARLTGTDKQAKQDFVREFCRGWLLMLVFTLIPVGIFSLLLLICGWSAGNIGLYIAGVMSNVFFLHCLIPTMEIRKEAVVAGWVAYGAVFFFLPGFWYLAPLAGAVLQIPFLGKGLLGLFQAPAMDLQSMLAKAVYGVLIGGVLWMDKFLVLVLTPNEENLWLAYTAIIPVTVTLAVCNATKFPDLQHSFDKLVDDVAHRPLSQLGSDISNSRGNLAYLVASTIAVSTSASLGSLLMGGVFGIQHGYTSLLLFLLPATLVAAYVSMAQLSQVRRHVNAAVGAGGYLVLVTVAFAFLSPLVGLVMALLVSSIVAMLAAVRVERSVVDAPYELFWQKAVA